MRTLVRCGFRTGVFCFERTKVRKLTRTERRRDGSKLDYENPPEDLMNFKVQESFVQHSRGSDEKTVEIFHSESSPDWKSSERIDINPSRGKIVVTGAFPMDESAYGRGEFVETIRDPRDPGRLAFLSWNNGSPI